MANVAPIALVGVLLLSALPLGAQASSPSQVASAVLDGIATAVSMDRDELAAAVAKDGATQKLDDNELFVYSVESGQLRWAEDDNNVAGLIAEGKGIVEFSKGTPNGPDGPYVVAAEEKSATTGKKWYIYTRDPPADRQAVASRTTENLINAMAISDDGQFIGIASGDSQATKNQTSLYKYLGATGGLQHLWNFSIFGNGNLGQTYDVAVSGDGRFLVAGADRSAVANAGAIYLFNTMTTVPNAASGGVALLRNPDGNVTSPIKHVAVTGNGKYFLGADATESGSNVYLCTNRYADGGSWVRCSWNAKVDGQATSLAVSYHGNNFAVGTDRGAVAIYEVRRDEREESMLGTTARLVGTYDMDGATSSPVSALAFSYDGQFLVAAASTGVYGFTNRTADPAWAKPLTVDGIAKAVGDVDISFDARRIVAIAENRLWILEQTRSVSLTADATPKPAAPGEKIQFRVTVRNTGSNSDNYTLNVVPPAVPSRWSSVTLNGSYVELLPDRQLDILLNATPPDTALPGRYRIDVEAQSQRALSRGITEITTLTVEVEVTRTNGVELTPKTVEDQMNAQETKRFAFTLRNAGNVDDQIRVTTSEARRSPGTQWTWTVLPGETVTLGAFQTQTVEVEVRPTNVEDGDFLELNVLAEAAQGTVGRSDAAKLIVRVNPRFDASLAPQYSEVNIEPGQRLLVNLTITNLGNTRDTFRLANFTEPRNPPGWRVSLSSAIVTIEQPGEKGIVRMFVTAPGAAQPGDVVTIVVELYSNGQDAKIDQKNIVVTVVPRSTGGFLGLPGFELPLLLLGVLFVATLRNRVRRS